ncbi:hypothetical protein DUNSADRAFT_4715 [Dunaliella salina]|uniref:Uncharacterized protein n=1 Tax=Dunaliella salina TaxID=3046 RepID=A0ABQ7H7J5_DUNSA|nr:hypothetical protein DUNSADRAFT_4715 [Dunaliella salina]|eukprot:KAF5842831.1 hypothetical protein DUNSADRAFT_4715 [Dunaliella salina]
MQREGHAAQYAPPDDTPCNSHRSSYLRDYTYSEDRPHSAGVRPRSLLNKVANASHAIQRDDSDDENEPWVLEGWKDEASTVLENACQSAKLPSKYTSNMPCPLPTNVRRVASAATSRPEPSIHKQLPHGQRQRAIGAPDGPGLHSKQAGVRANGATLSRSPRPPLRGQNLEVGDESDVDPSTARVQAPSSGRRHGPPAACTPGSASMGTHAANASTRPVSASKHPGSEGARPVSANLHPASTNSCAASAAAESVPAASTASGRGARAGVSRGVAGGTPTVANALSIGDVPPAPPALSRSESGRGLSTSDGISPCKVAEGTSLQRAPLPARPESSRGMRSGVYMGEHAPHAESSCVSNPLLVQGSLRAAGSCSEPVAHSRAPSIEHQEGSTPPGHPWAPEWVTPPKKQLPSLPSLHALGNGDGQPHLQHHQLPRLQVLQPEGSKVHHNSPQSPLLHHPNHLQPQNLQQQQQQQQHKSPHPSPHRQHHHHGLQPVRLYARSAAASMATQQPHWQSNRLKSADAILPMSHGYGPQTASLVSRLSLSPTRPQRSVSENVEYGSSQDSLPSPGCARISLQPLGTQLSTLNPSPPQQHHHLQHSPDHHHDHHHQHQHLFRDQHQHQPQPLLQAPLQHQQHLQQHDHLAPGGVPAPAVASPMGVDALLAEARLHRRPLPPPKPPPLPPSPMSQKAAEALLQHVRSKYGVEGGHLAAASAAQAREGQPKSQQAPSCLLPTGEPSMTQGHLATASAVQAREGQPRSQLAPSCSLPTRESPLTREVI